MSRSTPTLPGVASGVVQQNFDALNRRLGAVELAPVGELPKGGTVGESLLFEAAVGVYWHLVYTGEETYPWAKIGGPPLRLGPWTPALTSATSTFATSLTLPLAMEADVAITGAFMQNTSAGAGQVNAFAVVGAAAPIQAAMIANFQFATAPGPVGEVRTTAVKGAVVKMQANTSAAGQTGQISAMELTVDPVRVG